MKRITGFVLTLFLCSSAIAQENSPYSRYGLGDLVPAQNIVTRGMGGYAAGYSSGYFEEQAINFVNPASYANLSYIAPSVIKQNGSALRKTIFDFGFEIDNRSLKQIDPAAKYSATNLIISYVQLGLPVKLRKANKKGIFLGFNFGLRPLSRINYKIASFERKPGVDSFGTIYEGTGGMSEAMAGAGLRIKNFNIGFNSGYRFGNKSYSTRVSILNDTVYHYQSNSETKSNFGGVFFTLGTQYEIKLNGKKGSPEGAVLRLGAYTSLQQKMDGTQELLRQTIKYDSENGIYQVDSIFKNSQSGIVQYPSSWGAGFSYKDSSGHWSFGADYERSNWGGYRFFGQKDNVKNTWKIRGGAEYFPAEYGRTPFNKFFSYVKYRAGFYYGPSYIDLGKNMPEFGFSLGAGIPLKLRRSSVYETQSSYLNTLIEFGNRANKNTNLRESFFRIGFGLSLSDLWFSRQKYY